VLIAKRLPKKTILDFQFQEELPYPANANKNKHASSYCLSLKTGCNGTEQAAQLRRERRARIMGCISLA
jgi:hypothetical protein